MKDAAKKEGRTVLYVSHNMNTIRQLCDRCIVLSKGKVVYEGDVESSIAVYMDSEANDQVKMDFSDVIRERQRWYTPSEQYHMVAGDARHADWLATLPHSQRAIVVMEGLSMYLTAEELQNLLAALAAHFGEIALLMDCYTPLAAKLSRWKNPVHDVGVGQVYGVGDPEAVAAEGLPFLREHDMTPQRFIDQLAGREKRIFQKLYAGAMSHKLYRLYEYGKTERKKDLPNGEVF
jgi:hypothetical protein